MQRIPTLIMALLTPLAMVSSGAAYAASCANGKALYNKASAKLGLSCGNNTCHQATLSANSIEVGAQNPGAIETALNTVAEMQDVRSDLALTSSDIDDLAAWIFYGKDGLACPSTAPPLPPPPPLPPLPIPPPAATTVDVIEYVHVAFGHYFITHLTDEITKLDNGTFKGWARTGKQFKAWTQANADYSPVCRFFTVAFAPKSSHFYTPFAPECMVVKANKVWEFEAEVFFMQQASVAGVCPGSTVPVYRMYNNGQSGAPNHRYTTDFNVRAQMLTQGWIPEGAGALGVIMCSPP